MVDINVQNISVGQAFAVIGNAAADQTKKIVKAAGHGISVAAQTAVIPVVALANRISAITTKQWATVTKIALFATLVIGLSGLIAAGAVNLSGGSKNLTHLLYYTGVAGMGLAVPSFAFHSKNANKVNREQVQKIVVSHNQVPAQKQLQAAAIPQENGSEDKVGAPSYSLDNPSVETGADKDEVLNGTDYLDLVRKKIEEQNEVGVVSHGGGGGGGGSAQAKGKEDDFSKVLNAVAEEEARLQDDYSSTSMSDSSGSEEKGAVGQFPSPPFNTFSHQGSSKRIQKSEPHTSKTSFGSAVKLKGNDNIWGE
ncbi:MAG: hypothetical protein SP1CHLAM54_08240 [Chlamydiia bacterium]|nr:hypothetical protein [Chlamydiia bacterium]MCH9615730.1 hypothetical protein [Chlamydiia bacterium]MCH9628867.1 hypothetical protein [Chlamydiia bacterium]